EQGLHAVYPPFWADLPHTNIYASITPDLLHQIHKGVFKDHLLLWCRRIMGDDEVDRRFRVMSSHPSLRHFKSGILSLSQWSGKEAKQVEKCFISVIAGAIRGSPMVAARALMDFIMLAQYPVHTDETLTAMDNALEIFHQHKQAFIDSGARDQDHFDLPKLHSLVHYTDSIRLLGTADGFNTESPEHLHIDIAKKAYARSGRVDYIKHMTRWLHQQEAIIVLRSYLTW
ncbi:hypothetical protein BOTBODRAFT_75848, partial [Botryobasidium botryosum FD-172 SS1]